MIVKYCTQVFSSSLQMCILLLYTTLCFVPVFKKEKKNTCPRRIFATDGRSKSQFKRLDMQFPLPSFSPDQSYTSSIVILPSSNSNFEEPQWTVTTTLPLLWSSQRIQPAKTHDSFSLASFTLALGCLHQRLFLGRSGSRRSSHLDTL